MFPVQDAATDKRTLIAQSNMITPSDPRYAWVALYSRGADPRGVAKSSAHVVVLVVNRSDPFDASRVSTGADPYVANKSFLINSSVRSLEPRLVLMQFVGGDEIAISSIATLPGNKKFNANAAGPSGFVVISPDATQIPAGDLVVKDRNNGNTSALAQDIEAAARHLSGHVYRIGEDRGAGRFGLFPGNAFAPETFKYTRFVGTDPAHPDNGLRTVTITRLSQPVNSYIVGRNRDPVTGEFDGPVMDVAFYTSFITVN
jgi:hypothetical protein